MGDALRAAALHGNGPYLKDCLDAGTDIEFKDRDCRTAAYWAACKGEAECMKILVERGANVNAADNYGATPVHAASVWGKKKALAVLIGAGGDVNAVDKNGWTPLHWAAVCGKTACADILMEAGARRDIKNNEGRYPGEEAHSRGKIEEAAAIQSFVPSRAQRLLFWRRAVEAKRDAGMVFKPASEGRPMELARRLRLGKLAGGMGTKVITSAASFPAMLPIEAAMMNGHDECVRVLTDHESPGPSAAFLQYWTSQQVFSFARDGRLEDLKKVLLSQDLPTRALSTRSRLRTGQYVLPIEAAALMGHDECVHALRGAGSPELGPDFNYLLEQFRRLDATGSNNAAEGHEPLGGVSASGAATGAGSSMATPAHDPLPDGWEEGWHGGRIIYIHPASGRMQYDRPT